MDHSPLPVRSGLRRWPLVAGVAAAALAVLLSPPQPAGVPGPGGGLLQPGPLLWGLLVVLGAALLQRFAAAALGVLLLAAPAWAFVETPHHLLSAQLLPAAVGLGYVVGTRRRPVGVLAAVLTLAAVVVLEFGVEHGTVAQGRIVPMTLATALVWLLGDLIRVNRMQARAARAQATDQAVTAERLRIARELHDLVAHSIGIIAIQAGAGRRVIATQPAAAADALAAIETTSRETLAGLRRALVALRRADAGPGSELASLAPAARLADVERLVAATSAAGVPVSVSWVGVRRTLPPDVDLAGFRIVQEALTNVVRHAEPPASAVVRIGFDDDALVLEILDDGRGLVPGAVVQPGFGLIGMRERVSLLRGSFEAGPRPDGGFRVWARLPLEPDGTEAGR